MSEKALAELGSVKLSNDQEVKVTRLPIGGFSAVMSALENKDIVSIFKKAADTIESKDQEGIQMVAGAQILMTIPEVLVVFLKWTVSVDGEIPCDDDFINSIPVVDIPKIAQLCVKDISDIFTASKNVLGPMSQMLMGQDPQVE